MGISSRIIEIVEDHKEVIFEFFVIFSRFEYALKKAGYRGTNNWGTVSPDWSAFINKYSKTFNYIGESIEESYIYLDKNPVKRQILDKNGQLDWSDYERNANYSDLEWIIRLVKSVRNNLFHGAKFPFDPERDTRLLKAGLDILEYCASFDADLAGAFTAVYPKNN